MPHTVSRTSREMSTYAFVEISPATTTRPVVSMVSHATRPVGSSDRMASRTASEIWSAILSGWPSVTDSELNVQLVTTSSPLSRPSPVDYGIEHESRHRSLVHQRTFHLVAVGAEDDHAVGV